MFSVCNVMSVFLYPIRVHNRGWRASLSSGWTGMESLMESLSSQRVTFSRLNLPRHSILQRKSTTSIFKHFSLIHVCVTILFCCSYGQLGWSLWTTLPLGPSWTMSWSWSLPTFLMVQKSSPPTSSVQSTSELHQEIYQVGSYPPALTFKKITNWPFLFFLMYKFFASGGQSL